MRSASIPGTPAASASAAPPSRRARGTCCPAPCPRLPRRPPCGPEPPPPDPPTTGHLPSLRGRRGVRRPGVALALGAAGVVGAPGGGDGAGAARALGGLGLHLLPGPGTGVVVDVVVVDVLRRLPAHEAPGPEEGAAGWGGGGGEQRAPGGRGRAVLQEVVAAMLVRGARAGAVAAHARGLAAGGLEDPGQVVVQDGLRVLLIAARWQEGEGVLGGPRLPGAQRQLGALLLLVLEGKVAVGGRRGQQEGPPQPRAGGGAAPTSRICCRRSSRLCRVSSSSFSFSSREMSSAAKAAGSTGVISLGRRWVLCGARGGHGADAVRGLPGPGDGASMAARRAGGAGPGLLGRFMRRGLGLMESHGCGSACRRQEQLVALRGAPLALPLEYNQPIRCYSELENLQRLLSNIKKKKKKKAALCDGEGREPTSRNKK